MKLPKTISKKDAERVKRIIRKLMESREPSCGCSDSTNEEIMPSRYTALKGDEINPKDTAKVKKRLRVPFGKEFDDWYEKAAAKAYPPQFEDSDREKYNKRTQLQYKFDDDTFEDTKEKEAEKVAADVLKDLDIEL